jgi:hypothetical protein
MLSIEWLSILLKHCRNGSVTVFSKTGSTGFWGDGGLGKSLSTYAISMPACVTVLSVNGGVSKKRRFVSVPTHNGPSFAHHSIVS